MSLVNVLIIFATASISTAIALWYLNKTLIGTSENPRSDPSDEISFLFKGETLQHASEAGLRIERFGGVGSEWAALRARLAQRFPSFPAEPTKNKNTVTISSQSDTDLAKLEIRQIDDATHVQIIDQKTLPLEAQHKIRSLEAEVMVTSLAGTTAPYPIWQIDKACEVFWHNNAYEHLYQRIFEKDPSVIQPLFDIEAQTSNPLQSRRTSISSAIDENNFGTTFLVLNRTSALFVMRLISTPSLMRKLPNAILFKLLPKPLRTCRLDWQFLTEMDSWLCSILHLLIYQNYR